MPGILHRVPGRKDVMKKRISVKEIIRAYSKTHHIEEITIIEGVMVYYSGTYEKFFFECDISLVLQRNKLLKREVLASQMIAQKKLFIFLDDLQQENEEKNT